MPNCLKSRLDKSKGHAPAPDDDWNSNGYGLLFPVQTLDQAVADDPFGVTGLCREREVLDDLLGQLLDFLAALAAAVGQRRPGVGRQLQPGQLALVHVGHQAVKIPKKKMD